MNKWTLYKYSILLLINALLTSTIYAQNERNESGVNLKIGATSTLFNPNNGKLIHHANTGFTFGLEGVFTDGNMIIQPGIHLMRIPRAYSPVKSILNKPLEKWNDKHDVIIKIPARLNLYLLNTRNLKIKAGAGLIGLYSHDGINGESANNSAKKHYVSGGYTINAGIMFRPLILEIDYDSSFGNTFGKGPLYIRSLSFTAGFFF